VNPRIEMTLHVPPGGGVLCQRSGDWSRELWAKHSRSRFALVKCAEAGGFGGQEWPHSAARDRQECLPHQEFSTAVRVDILAGVGWDARHGHETSFGAGCGDGCADVSVSVGAGGGSGAVGGGLVAEHGFGGAGAGGVV
jgi:hypothetical protein